MLDCNISDALEDYLEAILELTENNNVARSKDIAKKLKVHRSTVTAALKSLCEKGYINYSPYSAVSLTKDGEIIAKDIIKRHKILRSFFVDILGVDTTTANEAACGMEHSLPREIVDKLICFNEFIKMCPRCINGLKNNVHNKNCHKEQEIKNENNT